MARRINRCVNWVSTHDRPVYTMASRCPGCGGVTESSSPAPFNPHDPYGEYRRALKRREQE